MDKPPTPPGYPPARPDFWYVTWSVDEQQEADDGF